MKKILVVMLLVAATTSQAQAQAQEITPEQLEIAEEIAAKIDRDSFSNEEDYDEYIISEIDYQLYEYNSEKSMKTLGRIIWNTIKPSTANAPTHDGRGRPDSKRERDRLKKQGGNGMRWRSP